MTQQEVKVVLNEYLRAEYDVPESTTVEVDGKTKTIEAGGSSFPFPMSSLRRELYELCLEPNRCQSAAFSAIVQEVDFEQGAYQAMALINDGGLKLTPVLWAVFDNTSDRLVGLVSPIGLPSWPN